MAIFTNSFDGGSAGSAVTTGNSGGANGTAFGAVSASVLYQSDTTAHGALSAGVDNPGTATAITRWAGGSTETAWAARMYLRISAAVANVQDVLEARAPNDSTYLARARLNTSGTLSVVDSAGTLAWTSSSVPAAGTWYCLSLLVGTGTTPANGTAQLAYRALGAASWAEDSGTLTGNYGAGLQLGNVRFGKAGTNSYTGGVRWDTLELRTGVDVAGIIGPYAPPEAGGWQLGSIAMGG